MRKRKKRIFSSVVAGKPGWSVVQGDSLDLLRLLPDKSVDAVVTDPPAGIGFMGKAWDSDRGGRVLWTSWLSSIMRECLRVLKPGGYSLVWALPRTSHRTGTAVEDAGFEIRDIVHHLFGTGFAKGPRKGSRGTCMKPAAEHWILGRKPFPKGMTVDQVMEIYGTGALNVDACRIATTEKLERVLGKTTVGPSGWRSINRSPIAGKDGGRWPAHLVFSHTEWCAPVGEVVLKGDSRAQTCKYLKRGEACRGHGNKTLGQTFHSGKRGGGFAQPLAPSGDPKPNGVLHGEQTVVVWDCLPGCPVKLLDEQSGFKRDGTAVQRNGGGNKQANTYGKRQGRPRADQGYASAGGASRFYYVAKPSSKERDAGCESLPTRSGGEATDRKDGSLGLNDPRAGAGRRGGRHNRHPTLKGIELMRWLIRLITPSGGLILDPFCGSGTTGCAAGLEGMRFLGFEKEHEFVTVSHLRNRYWRQS